jgi:gamma-glutamylcyclotransferase (GGCT)/AIG2-like uncharacterized protein YtfP
MTTTMHRVEPCEDGRGWSIVHAETNRTIDHQYSRPFALLEAERWDALCRDVATSPFLFVYGTLLDGVDRFVRGARPVADDRLDDYTLYGYEHYAAFPMMVPWVGGHVLGQVWRLPDDVSRAAEGLRTLDAFEGVPRVYDRIRVDLRDNQAAWTYVWRLGRMQGLVPIGPRWTGRRVADERPPLTP